MSYKKTFIVIAALCCMLPAVSFGSPCGPCPYGNNHQVNIGGATLFVDYFAAPAGTNDWLDVDCDGLFGFDPFNPSLPDQLARAWDGLADPENRWLIQYRGVGSGNGLKELDLFFDKNPVTGPDYVVPSDKCYINRTLWCSTTGVISPPANLANPGDDPYLPPQVDFAVMDVPTTWFVQAGNQADAYWRAHPLDTSEGYGQNPITSWNTGQSNKLKTLTRTNIHTSSPDANTIYDTPIAWVPIAIIANHGTGLQNVTQESMQYLWLTGRMPCGENLYACTRDSGSGTRNGAMNSLCIDPSWGRGDNVGTKSAVGSVAYVGPTHQQNNLDGSGIMEDAVTNFRLGVGYTGLQGSSRANGDATAGLYQILNVKLHGATQFVRPQRDNTVDTLDPNTGYQIGGNETFASVGDPNCLSGHPTMRNLYASDYLENITESINDFVAGDPCDQNNMPGQYLAKYFSLKAALTALPLDTNPNLFVPNPGYVAAINAYYKANGPITPAWDTGSGKVPNRVDGPIYSDGTNGNHYIFSDGVSRNDGTPLNARNMIMGDFDNSGTRDCNDINAMMLAIAHPRSFEPGTGVCPEIIGDFTADGNFTTEDVRYFADGLAVCNCCSCPSGVGKKLDRVAGFTSVDKNWTLGDVNHPIAGNFFGTTLATGNPYVAGDSRADIAKSNWKTVMPTIGAAPTADGKIGANDIDYLCWIWRGGLKQKYFSEPNSPNCCLYRTALHWCNVDEAVFMDLSCDLNGDLIIDYSDFRVLVQDILGTQFGDVNLDGVVDAADLAIAMAHLNQPGGWASGDMDGDGWVTECDINIIKGGCGGSGGASPDLDGDGFVNFDDFAIFANSWLQNI